MTEGLACGNRYYGHELRTFEDQNLCPACFEKSMEIREMPDWYGLPLISEQIEKAERNFI